MEAHDLRDTPITIIGSGAIGGTVGAFLTDAGYDVTLVDIVREHVDAMNTRGLKISGLRGERTFPVKAIHSDDLRGPLGVAFLCVKGHFTDGAMRQIAPLLAPDGFILSLQNGLNEEIIASYVGRERTVGAFVHFGADYIAPGEIVLDSFLGSGTTAAVAHKMGRRWIGCDLGYGAVQTARRRLQRIVQETGPGLALYHLDDAPPPPASDTNVVTVRCTRLDAQTAQIEIVDYQAETQTAKRRARAHAATDWRALVDAVDIDPAYNGAVLRPVVMDLPRKRRSVVQGQYLVQVDDAPTQIAVRVTDIFGQEQVIVQTV